MKIEAVGVLENTFSVAGGNIDLANTSFFGLFNGNTALGLSTAIAGGNQSLLDALNAGNLGATGVQDGTSSTLTFSSTATTPEPGTILGLLAVGSLGALTRKRKA